MPDNSKPVTSLSIARHTLQAILRTAIDAGESPCIGVIGRKNELTINHAVPITDAGREECADHPSKNSDLRHTLEAWKREKIVPCGIYFTVENDEIPDQSEFERLKAGLEEAVPELAGSMVILMPLMLNTAGCLEAFAYSFHRNSPISIPLTLEEDGQSTKNG